MAGGGRRENSGRKPAIGKQIVEARKLAARLRISVAGGWTRLGNSYAEIMDKAVSLALEGDRSMIKLLIEMGARAVDMKDDETPYKKMVEEFTVKLRRETPSANEASTEGELVGPNA